MLHQLQHPLTRLFTFLLIIAGISAKSQDIIHLKNGEDLKVKIVLTTEKEIEYKKIESPDGPIYVITMDQVMSFSKESDKNAVGSSQIDSLGKQLKVFHASVIRDSIIADSLRTQQRQSDKNYKSLSAEIIKVDQKLNRTDSAQNEILEEQRALSKKQDSVDHHILQLNASLKKIDSLNVRNRVKNGDAIWVPKRIGIGVDASGLISYEFGYGPALFMNFNLDPHVRFETELTATISSYKGHADAYSYFAFGLLGMKQREHANFYAGLKIIRFGKTTIFNPTIGGEFIFADRFSLGAEIGFPFAADSVSFGMVIPFNRVVFRYYLFSDVKTPQPKHNSNVTGPVNRSATQPQNSNPPADNTCASVKNGKFKMGNSFIITRNGDRQLQVNTGTKDTTEYKVVWLSDCQYQLTSIKGPAKVITVDILNVDDKGYTCSYYDSADKQKYTIRMNRVE